MNVLVTGCAGFISSHLIEELLKNNKNKIIGIDNFHSSTKENLEFIKSIDVNNRFIFIKADVRDFEDINKIIKKYNIKYIYHLAAIVSVQESIENPLLSNQVNVNGTLNILEAARLHKVKRVVFSSSAAVYGDEPSLPKTETSSTKPISPYGYEKLMSEQYMKLYSDLYRIETVSLRYFNVFGPRQSVTSDYSGVISVFDQKFRNSEIPIIYGNGTQYRDFIYVKDVVNANILAMNKNGISGEIFCVGTMKKTSIKDLFVIMNEKYNKEFKAIYKKARKADILESVCDNSKIKNILGLNNFSKFNEEIIKL